MVVLVDAGYERATHVLTQYQDRLTELAEALREPLAFDGIELLVQGEAPLRDLLRRMGRWEGVVREYAG